MTESNNGAGDTPRAWRVGVIGMGLMGRRMLGDLRTHPRFVCTSGFDADATRRATVCTEFDCSPKASADELLADPLLDCVYVATPPASHVELANRVLARGLPLFLEKPLAVDLDAARELVRVTEAGAPASAINFPFATLPGAKRIQSELSDGTAGKPLRVEVVLHFSQWPRTWHNAGAWLAGDTEGGFLREVFSHFAYLTQRFLGRLTVDSCAIERTSGRGETRVNAEMHAGAVPVALSGGALGAAPDFNQWTLFCENRCYRVQDWSNVSISTAKGWERLELDPGEPRGAQSQLDELAHMLQSEPHCLPSLRDGLHVMETVEELLRMGSRATARSQ